jgi:hypothetical protein
MNPDLVLSAWQLAVMAVVPVAALAIWLIAWPSRRVGFSGSRPWSRRSGP